MANFECGYNDSKVVQTYTDPDSAFASMSAGDQYHMHYPSSDGPDGAKFWYWNGPNSGTSTTKAVGVYGEYGNREISFIAANAYFARYVGDFSSIPANALFKNFAIYHHGAAGYCIFLNNTGGTGGAGMSVEAVDIRCSGGNGIRLQGDDTEARYSCVANCLATGILIVAAGPVVSNCTVVNSGDDGIDAYNVTTTVKNCFSTGSNQRGTAASGDFYWRGGTPTHDYNASGDATATGTNSITQKEHVDADFWGESITGTFIQDYRILDSSDLYHQGTNLSLTDDCDGNTPHATTPSIGWHEGTAGSFGIDYPSVGDVQDGVTYASGSFEGTLELPTEAQVEDGVGFGAGGTEFTGSLAGGGGRRSRIRSHGV